MTLIEDSAGDFTIYASEQDIGVLLGMAILGADTFLDDPERYGATADSLANVKTGRAAVIAMMETMIAARGGRTVPLKGMSH